MTCCSCVCSPVHKKAVIYVGVACELVNLCWQWKSPGNGRDYTHLHLQGLICPQHTDVEHDNHR